VNICEFLNGTQDSIVTKWYFGQFGSSLPKHLMRPCPHLGIESTANVSLDLNNILVSHFFPGTYVANVRFYDELDDNVFTMRHESVFQTIYFQDKKRKSIAKTNDKELV
jgi:hypothetical protein